MLYLNSQVRYFFYNAVVDMRKGVYGLCGLVNNELQADLYTGDVFIFLGRRRNKIKLLQWDKDGFALYEKRLSRGCFEYPTKASDKQVLLSSITLQHILQGVVLQQVMYKKRYAKMS